MRRNILAAAVILGAVSAAAMADSLTAGEGRNAMTLSVDRVTGFKDGAVVYLHREGGEKDKALSQILQITIDGQDVFNRAEQKRRGDASAQEEAITMYEEVANGEAKDWLKQIARYRRVELAGRRKMLDAAVAGWLDIVATDKSSAAIRLLPQEALGKGDEKNAAAIAALEPKIKELRSRGAVVHKAAADLLMKLYQAEGLTEKADELAASLSGQGSVKVPAGSTGTAEPDGSSAPVRPAAGTGQETGVIRSGSLLTGAAGLIRAGQDPKTLAEQASRLEAGMDGFSSSDLPTAYMLVGKAKLYQATAPGQTDAKVKESLLAQAGLSFMRARIAADKPAAAAEGLRMAGYASELMGNLAAAEKAYTKIVNDKGYQTKAKDVVAEAKTGLERVQKEMSKKKPAAPAE